MARENACAARMNLQAGWARSEVAGKAPATAPVTGALPFYLHRTAQKATLSRRPNSKRTGPSKPDGISGSFEAKP